MGMLMYRQGQLGMARQKYLKALKLIDSAYVQTESDEQVRLDISMFSLLYPLACDKHIRMAIS